MYDNNNIIYFSQESDQLNNDLVKIKLIDHSFRLEINSADDRKKLMIFKNFSQLVPFNEIKIIFYGEFSDINQVKKFLQIYSKYRDVILDISRISSSDNNYDNPIVNNIPHLKSIAAAPIFNSLEDYNNISIEDFPIIDDEKRIDYFKKLLSILLILSKKIKGLKHCFTFTSGQPTWKLKDEIEIFRFHTFKKFPMELIIKRDKKYIYYNSEEDFSNLTLYISFIGIPFSPIINIYHINYEDIRIKFLINYLFHYNLQDQIIAEIQKKILEAIYQP